MIYNGSVALYKDIKKDYNVKTKKEVEVKDYLGTFTCGAYAIADNVRDGAQGRITGKTLEVYFLQTAPKFKYAEYEGRFYKPTSYANVAGMSVVELEEVVV